MSKPRVAVLMGGPSSEHDVSLRSGSQVLAALEPEFSVPVVIGKNGVWSLGGEAQPSVGRALDELRARADVVFIAMHGPFGEDGTVQGMLTALGMPFVGSGVAASGLAMDKVRAKQIYVATGLPTPEFAVFRAWTHSEAAVREAAARLGERWVVKPSCNGSSFGVSFPKSVDALVAAVSELVGQGNEVLVERFVKGTELTCGVLEDAEASTIRALPVTEIVPTAKYEFFDYEAKYTPGATDEITPARIPDALRDRVQALALAAHEALGCRDMSRTDVMIAPDGAPLLLETNTIPGFTAQSLLPQAAQAAGLDFPALVDRLVRNAVHRGAVHA